MEICWGSLFSASGPKGSFSVRRGKFGTNWYWKRNKWITRKGYGSRWYYEGSGGTHDKLFSSRKQNLPSLERKGQWKRWVHGGVENWTKLFPLRNMAEETLHNAVVIGVPTRTLITTALWIEVKWELWSGTNPTSLNSRRTLGWDSGMHDVAKPGRQVNFNFLDILTLYTLLDRLSHLPSLVCSLASHEFKRWCQLGWKNSCAFFVWDFEHKQGWGPQRWTNLMPCIRATLRAISTRAVEKCIRWNIANASTADSWTSTAWTRTQSRSRRRRLQSSKILVTIDDGARAARCSFCTVNGAKFSSSWPARS